MPKRDKKQAEKYRKRPCDACGSNYHVAGDHIKTFGSGGTCDDYNMWSLCFVCHRFKEDHTKENLIAIYPHLEEVLLYKGWEYCDYNEKWIYPHKEDL